MWHSIQNGETVLIFLASYQAFGRSVCECFKVDRKQNLVGTPHMVPCLQYLIIYQWRSFQQAAVFCC